MVEGTSSNLRVIVAPYPAPVDHIVRRFWGARGRAGPNPAQLMPITAERIVPREIRGHPRLISHYENKICTSNPHSRADRTLRETALTTDSTRFGGGGD